MIATLKDDDAVSVPPFGAISFSLGGCGRMSPYEQNCVHIIGYHAYKYDYTHFSKGIVMQVGIRELKAGLSQALAQAQAGEVIEVTSHNRPIARIVGIPAHGDEGLRHLMASGALTWSGGKPEFEPPLVLSPSGTPVSQMVLEDRG